MQPTTTLIPSSTPSFTGLIALFDVTKVVTMALTDSDINAIQSEVMESFEISEDEFDTTSNTI